MDESILHHIHLTSQNKSCLGWCHEFTNNQCMCVTNHEFNPKIIALLASNNSQISFNDPLRSIEWTEAEAASGHEEKVYGMV